MAVRALVVDDVAHERSALRHALDARDEIEVVGELADGLGAAGLARVLQPDVVVLALGLRDLASRDVLARIRAASPRSQVVICGGPADATERALLSSSADGSTGRDDVSYVADLVARLGRRHYQARSVKLGARPGDVRRARRFTSGLLSRWGRDDMRDAALTVVSELVANAIVHARSTSELRIAQAEGVLHIEVTDFGSGAPVPRISSTEEEHGRGLLLVSALSAAWGMHGLSDGGKVVWAELDLPDPASSPDRLVGAEY